jgi:type II secretory pathway pseudopilin PulG
VTSARRAGVTLVELLVVLGTATLLLGLVGTVYVTSLSSWRRGRDAWDAHRSAAILSETIARDVRGASQAPHVTIAPEVPVRDATPILSLVLAADDVGAARWVVYARREALGDVIRVVAAPGADGRLAVVGTRVVAVGVERVTVRPSGRGVTIEAVVRRGRDVASSRTTAAPMNP